jgi:hypothetical protein
MAIKQIVSKSNLGKWIDIGVIETKKINPKLPLINPTSVTFTPAATGNTTNLNEFVKDSAGDVWFIDYAGNAVKFSPPTADIAYSKMLFVDAINGDDTTGTGSDNKMFKTIAKALTVASGSGYRIVLAAGIYAESPTISLANIDIVTVAGSDRGNTTINGTVTFTHTSSSSGIQGIAMTNLVHSGAGALYVTDCQINTLLNKTSAAYIEITDTQLQGTATSTLSAGTGLIKECHIANMTISGAASGYTLKSNLIDANGAVTFTGGAFYNIQDNSGNIITTAGINMETGLIASGLSAALAKQYVTDFSTKLGMINPDTNGSPTKFVTWNETTKRLEISDKPSGLPTGGTDGQVLTVQPDGSYAWESLPDAPATGQNVYFNAENPASGTIFDTENPPVTNNNALKNNSDNTYYGTDGSVWTWNGTAYVTKVYSFPSHQREVITATGGQSIFTMSKTPIGGTEKVHVTRNGVDISRAFTWVGAVGTYNPSNNYGCTIDANDILQFHFESY